MKAVIVDLDGRRAAAFCEDGSVREVENLDYCLGQTITIEEVTEAEEDEPVTEKSKIINYKKWYKKLASAAAVVLILTGIGGASVYAMPYGEVSLDAGSSVIYTINRFDYVLSAEAAAEEGARIIAEVGKENLVNRKIENAVETTLDQIQKNEGSEPDLVYQIRIDIGGNKGGANEAHTEKLQKKLKKVLSDKAPAVEAPEEIKEETERESVMHPDGQPVETELAPMDGDSEKQPNAVTDGGSAVMSEADQKVKPENLSKDTVDEKQVSEPTAPENAPEKGAEEPDNDRPQEMFGGQPDERPDGSW